jgi:F-type H+-transporting ATPase subunit epsilon
MAKSILLEVVTPERLLFSKPVEVVVCTGIDGEFAVLAGHVPLLAALDIGEMRFRDEKGSTEYVAIDGGFTEVTGEKVTVLAEGAEMAREIDVDRAQRARERAEKRIAKGRADMQEYVRAEAELKRAMLRLRLAEKHRTI